MGVGMELGSGMLPHAFARHHTSHLGMCVAQGPGNFLLYLDIAPLDR